MKAADDDDDAIPTDNLAHAIAWLEKKHLIERPDAGATKAVVAAFEERHGMTLPADYKRFLETYGYLDGRVHVFGIVNGEPAHDLETMRNHLREYIDTALAPLDGSESYAADWRANAEKMRKLTPIMALGNPLLYAPGILIDAKERYYRVDVRGFVNEDSFEPEPEGTTFDALLLEELAAWYADD